MLFELETDVPESRELRLTLPPDAPTGRVKVTLAPVEPSPGPPTHPKLALEHAAFAVLLPQLLATHAGRYVAVHDGRVIASGDSAVAVLTAAERTHPGAFPLAALVSADALRREKLPSIRGRG